MVLTLLALAILALFALLPLLGLAVGLPWLPLAITFVLVPLLDAWVGRPPVGETGSRRGDPAALRWLPRAQVPLQALLLVTAVWMAPSLSPSELFWFTLAVGNANGGIGITVAHELGHRPARLDRVLARLLLVTVGYAHFYVEHNRGHHVRVATPDDPASAPAGVSVYRFFVRSVIGQFRHAWRLERLRLEHRGRCAWHPANWVLSGTLLWLALLALAWLASGTAGLLLMLGQAAVAVALLEVINYIEHYGLRRERRGAGWQPVGPQHAWDADFPISNWLLFNLQLHADHHTHVERPFHALRATPMAPQLPAGYPALVLVALLPPLWFALMDQRLLALA